jgi:uncharacterized protein
MPEYLAPGVYVEEVDTGSKPIEGVSTSTSGMVGVTAWGPENVATLVTGFADFQRQFGGYLDRRTFTDNTSYLPHAVEGFFTNGGKRLYITRICADNATSAGTILFNRGQTGGASSKLAAPTRAGDNALLVFDTTGMAVGEWLKLDDGNSTEYQQIASLTEAGVMVLRGTFHFAHSPSQNVQVVTTTDVAAANSQLDGAQDTGTNIITLDAVGAFAVNDILRLATGADREYVIVKSIDTTAKKLTLKYPLNFSHVDDTPVQKVTVTLTATPTKLATQVKPGEGLLILKNATGFAADAIVEIAGGTLEQKEYHTIDTLRTIVLKSPATFSHVPPQTVEIVTATDGTARNLSANIPAGANSINLADVTGITAGTVLRINAATSANVEYAIVESVNATTKQITLKYPLAFAHNASTPVRDVTVSVTASSKTTIASRLNPKETTLLLVNRTGLAGYAANAIVRIHGATADKTEYRVIQSLPTISTVLLGTNATNLQALAYLHLPEISVVERSSLLTVQAIDRGAWGNCLRITVEDDAPILDTTVSELGSVGDPWLKLRSTVGIDRGSILEIGYTKNPDGSITPGFLQKVETVDGNRVGFDTGSLGVNVNIGDRVRTREFKLTVQCIQDNPLTGKPRVVASEVHRQLSMDPRHGRYAVNEIGAIFHTGMKRRLDGRTEGNSNLIRIEDVLADANGVLDRTTAEAVLRLGPDLIWETLPDGRRRAVGRYLAGGDDKIGEIIDQTYLGDEDLSKSYPEDRTGLFSLKRVDEISIIAIPGRTSQTVQQASIEHCELSRYRFAVLDSAIVNNRSEITVPEVQENRSLFDTKYAALYYPWLRIADPFPENPRVVGQISIPPSGHTIGIYARSDIERGVYKAPANEVIRGIQDLALKITKEEQDILNPRNINVLRNFRENNRGLRVWGARTLSSDPDWKYINVRRLFIFIENSIDRGTQWVVFEPNDEPLWQRVKRVITGFLTQVWRDGALMGRTPEQAFYVKCDRTTMTQNDIDNGRLIVLIGIAPVKPAEFVIFRIGQWAGGSSLEEG